MSHALLDDAETTALKQIRTAVWAAGIVGGLNLALRMGAVGTSAGETLIGLSDPLIMLALSMWLHRKRSRAAAISILVLFLLGKVALWLPLLAADSPQAQDTLSRAFVPQLFMTCALGYAFLQGIRGTIALRRVDRSPQTAQVLSTEASTT